MAKPVEKEERERGRNGHVGRALNTGEVRGRVEEKDVISVRYGMEIRK